MSPNCIQRAMATVKSRRYYRHTYRYSHYDDPNLTGYIHTHDELKHRAPIESQTQSSPGSFLFDSVLLFVSTLSKNAHNLTAKLQLYVTVWLSLQENDDNFAISKAHLNSCNWSHARIERKQRVTRNLLEPQVTVWFTQRKSTTCSGELYLYQAGLWILGEGDNKVTNVISRWRCTCCICILSPLWECSSTGTSTRTKSVEKRLLAEGFTTEPASWKPAQTWYLSLGK